MEIFGAQFFQCQQKMGRQKKKNAKLKRLMKDITIQIVVHNKANLNNSSPILALRERPQYTRIECPIP